MKEEILFEHITHQPDMFVQIWLYTSQIRK